MYPVVAAALKFSWWQKIVFKFALRAAIKRLNKVGKGYFTRSLAFEIRQKIIRELLREIEWAKTKTPDFEVDEQALQCAAWVLESDTIQQKLNAQTGANIDVHARWTTSHYQP